MEARLNEVLAGVDRPVTWEIPENASITPGPLPGPALEGMVISSWGARS
ncbi:MAG: hypothetical protein JST91_08605 [Actinobacteria bacterium]|nr:hypothetical protein [Actinomycetota bacterium]